MYKPTLILLFIAFMTGSNAQNLQYQIRRGEIPCKGVNLGGWLVAERWMTANSVIWNGVPDSASGEFQTMQYLGHQKGDAAFEEHRKTWITEADIKEMKSFGINTARVPVGYWIRGEDPTDVSNKQEWKVFAPGGLKYLDKLINEWAPKYEIAVLVDIHAAKGSQNGAEHSAPTDGQVYWDKYQENIDNTVQLAKFFADRYRDSSFFLGVGLLNEPAYNIDVNKLTGYYNSAYQAIRNTGNDCVITIAPPLSSQYYPNLIDVLKYPNAYNTWMEWHPYFAWGDYNTWEKVLAGIDAWTKDFQTWEGNGGNWLLISEWSLGAQQGAIDSDTRKKAFANAQLGAFGKAHSGYTFWSWRKSGDENGADDWSMRSLLRAGTLKL